LRRKKKKEKKTYLSMKEKRRSWGEKKRKRNGFFIERRMPINSKRKKSFNWKKKQRKPQNLHFWYICIIFSIFNIISEEFKFSKVFETRSTFNAIILQSLIFLVESTLILLVLKKYKKNISKLKFWGFRCFFAIFGFFCKFIKIWVKN